MLTIKTQCNLGNAERYFKEHLQHGDYYSQRGAAPGQWIGTGAERLSLSGIVKQEDFLALCHNQNPHTGNTLTQRLKTTRQEIGEDGRMHQVANRRIFYDFTFSPPKSVSILALVTNDQRIVQAHQRASRVAVQELENFAGTRVHHGKAISERLTDNVICALFQHDTSRALDPPGETAKPLTITASHLVVEGVARVGRISFDHLDRLTVCRPKPLALAEGDRLQLKANARTTDGREFVNGELVVSSELTTTGAFA